MSIVTYENADTPVFEIDYPRYLFTDGAQGLWLPYQPDHLYADVDKTVFATIGGGIASFDDLSGNGVTGPQPTSTARPIFRASPARGEYDSADDVLPKDATLPAITDGTVILIGQQGIWIDEGYSFAGGNWSFGPTTYTGGPTGIIGVVGNMLDLVVIDRPLTADERDRVVAYGVRRGSAGLITVGPELVPNPGGPFTTIDGWGTFGGGTLAVAGDDLEVTRSAFTSGASIDISGLSGKTCIVESIYSGGTSNGGAVRDTITTIDLHTAPGSLSSIYAFNTNNLRLQVAGGVEGLTNLWWSVSVRRLIMPGETP